MKQEDIQRRIQRLLALAESDNENEALAAIKAARKLMMKYNVSVGKKETESYHTQKVAVYSLKFKRIKMDRFHLMSAHILAKNFRCKTYCHRDEIIFMGFQEDACAVLSLMEYMVHFMESGVQRYVEHDRMNRSFEYKTKGTEFLKKVENSWKQGFQLGLKRAFEEQNKEDKGYELMETVPKEVREAYEKLNPVRKSARDVIPYEPFDPVALYAGENSGKRAVDGRSLTDK